MKLAQPTMNQRGARSGDSQPGRCAMSTSAWRTKPIDARAERLARVAVQHDPGEAARSATPSVASRCPRRHRRRATARPIGMPPVAGEQHAAHCASAQLADEPLGLRGIDATSRATPARRTRTRTARRRSAGRGPCRSRFPTILGPACARSISFARSATAARSTRCRHPRVRRRRHRRLVARLSDRRAAHGDRAARHDARRSRRR